MRMTLRRAAIIAALSLLSTPSSYAQTKASKSETYKDIIEKAYNLSLQRDRQQALNILSAAIQREDRPQAVTELKKTIFEVSNIFFSDKAQQLYEIGVSMRKSEPNQALDKMAEAARIEPDNFPIVNELARLLIGKGDCKGGLETVRKMLLTVPFDEDLKLTQAQALACQGRWQDYQKVAETVSLKKSPHYKFWLALEIQRHLDLNQLTKAQESIAALKKVDEKYPEVIYWAWKLGLQSKRQNVESGHKYVMTCKNISANQYRQYMIDPMLCRRTTEVEGELKGMNGTPE